MTDIDELLENVPLAPPTLAGAAGRPAYRIVNVETARRNRRNKSRGITTSRALAEYLGIEDVERRGLPWDCQGKGLRLQSKRDLLKRGPISALALIEAIPAGDWMRGLFQVPPRAQLKSGTVTLLLEEWVAEHGWKLPPYSSPSVAPVSSGLVPLVTILLPSFRDYHCGRAAA